MKKKIAIFMAVVCLVFLGVGMSVHALEYNFCPQCGAGVYMYMEHVGDWNNVRTFEEKGGPGVIYCQERYSLDRQVKYCTNGCGAVWRGELIETSTHSVAQCPYNK